MQEQNDNEYYVLSPGRALTEEERSLVWTKPLTHKVSEEERRISNEIKRNWDRGEMKIANVLLEGDAGSGKTQLAKALSANFRLPYTKVTCFADMDKSDIIGAILPVITTDRMEHLEPADQAALRALYDSDGFRSSTEILMEALGISREHASAKMKHVLKLAANAAENEAVEYRFYASEIVRAFQNGYLLEIQEPNVIRDAAVLMALNSALELGGTLNLPMGIVHRHPDFIAVITANRSYAGSRPLNEALRDRIQHSEKIDLPTKEMMMERAKAKIGCEDNEMLDILARVIILLDKTARVNAMKGIAGMRSYFYWADAVAQGASARESLYHKVIYKITTDPEEIKLLEDALEGQGLLGLLGEIPVEPPSKRRGDAVEISTWDIDMDADSNPDQQAGEEGIRLKKSAESEGSTSLSSDESAEMESTDSGEEGTPNYHQANPEPMSEEEKQKERDFRKKLNRVSREIVSDSLHRSVKLIVHRPDYDPNQQEEYGRLSQGLMPVVREIARKTLPLLEHEITAEYAKNQYFGSKFQADSVAYRDFRLFAKKRPPTESPGLVVGLRVDESASMAAFGRLEAAKRAVIAVYEFCQICHIPVLIYGDTADVSRLEQMSIFAYADYDHPDVRDRFRLMGIRARSNNRDGMALRIMAERLAASPKQTKLMISISDGQPKAMEDYTGSLAIQDMQQTLSEYERKGVKFLAAAIGQDKDVISRIYGAERFLDITNLNELPAKLVRIISRYL
ncbi:AAA domain (dynein-related subfamily) [Paenibacillus sp. cl141a]|uniref:AAA family ATPase n=1 Tax=Paenibacillus sp. cl141a TaxID=1761877 RepID=UPI0008AD10B8|nr:AAA family ATPase [Paenibacillus sp. cl141a]SEM51966.1 AAA domain (dynein-related subfamily) [Paenibacillus sp. cl141a]